MRVVTRVLIVAALAFGSGCVQTDWIDRTLVTVDVTGTWYGRLQGGSSPEVLFDLEQQGSTVKGFMRVTSETGGGQAGAKSGPIDGTVAGDVFRFRQTNGRMEGELTVSGDEMNGRATLFSSQPFSLQRVDPSSRPDSPRR